MPAPLTSSTSSADNLYQLLLVLAGEEPSVDSTRRLNKLIALACAYALADDGAYGNLFSQVAQVCRRCHFDHNLTTAIQEARRRSNQAEALPEGEWRGHLLAAARLIEGVTATAIPGELRKLLPALLNGREKGLEINSRKIRCMVNSFDDHHIHATTDAGAITIDYGTTKEGRDFAYLRKTLREGQQLNLLDNHVEGTLVTPWVIVVEPDFLIDISSLAACFTDYGHNPLLFTLNRLKPRANTQAILLGNFAGTALDDLINHPDGYSTAQSLRRSFLEQVLQFCTCKDFQPEAFKRAAEQQVTNIRAAVDKLFAQYSRDEALLEPSFVCEALGLQGRVDLMTADLKLLVEQKSGKNFGLERHYNAYHEAHFVQLTLYLSVLERNFGKPANQFDERLLYSRYPVEQGLISMVPYKKLLYQAIALRNQIVATDLLIAEKGFGWIRKYLTPDYIYKGTEKSRFFYDYILPQMPRTDCSDDALLTHYYERMMTFVFREQVRQKLASGEAMGGCTADLWLMPLEEKKDTGQIMTGLTVTGIETNKADGTFNRITLHFPAGEEASQLNFRRGDMVYLYRYQGTPDVRQNILYKGSLALLKPNEVVVELNETQRNEKHFQGGTWAVEPGSSDVGTASQMRALQAFITCEPQRRDLLLGRREPRADLSRRPKKAYHPNYDGIMARFCQADDYFLLIGPPGTGKTSMALRFMVEEALPGTLLLSAYTNRAIDEICDMLTTAGLPFLRIGNPASCDPRFIPNLLEEALATTTKLDQMKALIGQARIIVATTSTLQARPYIFEIKTFDWCIIDEASQLLEPAVIGVICQKAVKRFCLIGDYKQLPAVVQQSAAQSVVTEPDLREIGLTNCAQSLFERLLHHEEQCHREQFTGVLNHQGRMHPEVAAFASQQFYRREGLDVVPLPHQKATALNYPLPPKDELDQQLCTRRALFLDCRPDPGHSATDKANAAEARLAAEVVSRVARQYGEKFDPFHTLGVIVPYRNQIAAIRQVLARMNVPHWEDISIDTVERYQGSQRDVIVYSFTVKQPYQLDFLTQQTFEEDGRTIDRKLNVALTRARLQMVLIGNAPLLSRNPLFKQLIANLTK